MKKILSIILICTMFFTLSACSDVNNKDTNKGTTNITYEEKELKTVQENWTEIYTLQAQHSTDDGGLDIADVKISLPSYIKDDVLRKTKMNYFYDYEVYSDCDDVLIGAHVENNYGYIYDDFSWMENVIFSKWASSLNLMMSKLLEYKKVFANDYEDSYYDVYSTVEKQEYIKLNDHNLNKYYGKFHFKTNEDADESVLNFVTYSVESNNITDSNIDWVVLDFSNDQSKGDLIDTYANTIAYSLREYASTE